MTSNSANDVRCFSESDAKQCASQYFNLHGSATLLYGEDDQNFLISAASNEKYVLKISRPGSNRDWLASQAGLLDHVQARQLDVVTPIPIRDVTGKTLTEHTSGNYSYPLRMLSWVEGALLDTVDQYDEELLKSLGKSVAKVDVALRDYTDAAVHRYVKWDSRNVMDQENGLAAIRDEQRRKMASDLLRALPEKLLAKLYGFPKSVIHNDGGNQHNMLVTRKGNSWRVKGIIDFGDAVLTYPVLGLGIACAYGSFCVKQPEIAIRLVSRGYTSVAPLTRDELAIIPWAAIARWLTTVISAAERASSEPDNEYAQVSAEPAWRALELMVEQNIDKLGHELNERSSR